MRFLLDTCTLLWVFAGSSKISGDLRDELTDPGNDLYFSDASVLEIVIKYQLGKLPLAKPPSRLLFPLAQKHLIDHAPLSAEAIFGLEKLPLHHRDPFDRLLVAQARAERLTLVTPDPKIHRYDVRWRW